MDSDKSVILFANTKLYGTTDNYMAFYDSDGEDDARSYFPCPFCCVEIEVPVLCSHLQEEHCFDLKNAVCGLFSLVYIFNFDVSLQRVFC